MCCVEGRNIPYFIMGDTLPFVGTTNGNLTLYNIDSLGIFNKMMYQSLFHMCVCVCLCVCMCVCVCVCVCVCLWGYSLFIIAIKRHTQLHSMMALEGCLTFEMILVNTFRQVNNVLLNKHDYYELLKY